LFSDEKTCDLLDLMSDDAHKICQNGDFTIEDPTYVIMFTRVYLCFGLLLVLSRHMKHQSENQMD